MSRVTAFVLRGQTLSDDLTVWVQVENALPRQSGIQLVAYCDGRDCLTSMSAGRARPPFPVVGYAALIDAQAILNADFRGACLVKELANSRPAKRVTWRGGASIATIVAEMVKP